MLALTPTRFSYVKARPLLLSLHAAVSKHSGGKFHSVAACRTLSHSRSEPAQAGPTKLSLLTEFDILQYNLHYIEC